MIEFVSSFEIQTVVGLGLVNILVIPEEMVLLLSDLDGATTILHKAVSLVSPSHPTCIEAYLRNQHLITSLDTHRYPLSIFIESAGSDGKNIGLVEFLDTAFGQEDAAGGAGFGFDSLYEHAVQEWDERLDGLQSGGLLGLWLVFGVMLDASESRRASAFELPDRLAARCSEDMVLAMWIGCRLTMLAVER